MARDLTTIKTLLQINDSSQDALLATLADLCSAEYQSRTHQPEDDDPIIALMVVERYNKLGNEGVTSMGYSGISESFDSDYSEAVQKLIRSKARMVAI